MRAHNQGRTSVRSTSSARSSPGRADSVRELATQPESAETRDLSESVARLGSPDVAERSGFGILEGVGGAAAFADGMRQLIRRPP
jgi:hypothetical protein